MPCQIIQNLAKNSHQKSAKDIYFTVFSRKQALERLSRAHAFLTPVRLYHNNAPDIVEGLFCLKKWWSGKDRSLCTPHVQTSIYQFVIFVYFSITTPSPFFKRIALPDHPFSQSAYSSTRFSACGRIAASTKFKQG